MFITEDPAQDGMNWYAYCGHNPVNFVDSSGLYDREAAVSYASKWAHGTNSPTYERFDTVYSFISSFGRMRGDCANFVSQCLVAGGLRMKNSWHYAQVGTTWCSGSGNHDTTYQDRDMTPTWANAKAQFEFFGSDWAGYKDGEVLELWTVRGMKDNIKWGNIREGDLMFFAPRDTKEVHHSTIIVEVMEDEIYFAGHTTDRDHEMLSSKLQGEMVYIVRVRDDAVNGFLTN